MAQFRSRPVVIEAVQWFKNGDHPEDNCDMFDYLDEHGNVFTRPGEGKVVRYYRNPQVLDSQACGYCGRAMLRHGWIDTLEGGHVVCPGDWVVTGTAGEKYPVKPGIFSYKYEPAE